MDSIVPLSTGPPLSWLQIAHGSSTSRMAARTSTTATAASTARTMCGASGNLEEWKAGGIEVWLFTHLAKITVQLITQTLSTQPKNICINNMFFVKYFWIREKIL